MVDAYNVLQDAVVVASTACDVWVAEGTYVRPAPDNGPVLAMRDGVEIYGGFAGTEQSLSERGDPSTHVSRLDGEDESYHVVVAASNARLDGFDVINGNAVGDLNFTVFGDSPDAVGGGVYNDNTTGLTVANCEIRKNYGSGGGGMFNNNSSPIVTDCKFIENTANVVGGGMLNDASSPHVRDCTFSENAGYSVGGAMSNSDSSVTMINCTVVSNYAASNNNIHNERSTLGMVNSIVWDIHSELDGTIYNESSTTTVTFSVISGGCAATGSDCGLGNTDADPRFVTGPYGDYYLDQVDSPCIDAGTGVPSDYSLEATTTSNSVTATPDTGTVDIGFHYPLP